MAITWGRSNVGGGQTYGTSYPATEGRVMGATTTTQPRQAVRKSSPAPVQSSQPVQSYDYALPEPSYNEPDVNAIYGPQMEYLSKAEAQLRSDLPTYEKEVDTNFATNKSQLDTNRNKTMGDISSQQLAGERKYEDAGTAARRLFQEQQMGMSQRFGGASSAGEAGQAIVGQELQRQLGSNQRGLVDFTSQIERQKTNIDQQYNTDIMGLEQQKQTALSQIRRDFQSKLLEIAQNRAQLESAKAQMRMQALMDFRNQVYGIQLQNAQFKNAVNLQREQAMQSISQNASRMGGYANAAQSAYSSFAPSSGTAIQMSGGQPDVQGAMNNYMGRVYKPGKNDEIIMGGLNTGSPTVLGGRTMAY